MGAQRRAELRAPYVSIVLPRRRRQGLRQLLRRRSPRACSGLAGDRGRASAQRGRIRAGEPAPASGSDGDDGGPAPRATEPTSPDFAPVRVDRGRDRRAAPRPRGRRRRVGRGHRTAVALPRPPPRHAARISCTSRLPPAGPDPVELAARYRIELAEEIDPHLRGDGLSPPAASTPTASGPRTGRPACAPLDDLLPRAPSVSVVIPTRNRPSSLLDDPDGHSALATTPATVTR